MANRTKSKEGLRKVSRLVNEIEMINWTIEGGVTGPEWQRLTLHKNEIFARIVSLITVIQKDEIEQYAKKYRRKNT